MSVSLISITPDIAETMVYCARVSSDKQGCGDTKLLNYCARNGHWSVFEMGNMVVEVITSRAISRQILRHRSFSFQEFSQRYAVNTFEPRIQDLKNRQNSIETTDEELNDLFKNAQSQVIELTSTLYSQLLESGIAKEQARIILPELTTTKLYINGTIRSWIHYCQARCHKSAQKEHRDIAEQIKDLLLEQIPELQDVFL
jgi:thymidylate synthase (FAD)